MALCLISRASLVLGISQSESIKIISLVVIAGDDSCAIRFFGDIFCLKCDE